MADKQIGFGLKAATRIKNAVIRVERQPYFQDAPIRWQGRGVATLMMPAITTTAITPFNTNTNTYGTGGVTVFMPEFNTNTNTWQQAPNNSYNTNSTVLNNFTNNGANINSGIRCQVYVCGGQLIYGGGDC